MLTRSADFNIVYVFIDEQIRQDSPTCTQERPGFTFMDNMNVPSHDGNEDLVMFCKVFLYENVHSYT